MGELASCSPLGGTRDTMFGTEEDGKRRKERRNEVSWNALIFSIF